MTEEVPETAEAFDDEDVQTALKRETDDGPGEDEVPESDFVEYEAGENVTAHGQEDND